MPLLSVIAKIYRTDGSTSCVDLDYVANFVQQW